jgi:hypothetical protein
LSAETINFHTWQRRNQHLAKDIFLEECPIQNKVEGTPALWLTGDKIVGAASSEKTLAQL